MVSESSESTASENGVQRRHDVDWLRTIALGLLIVFHILLCFQSWAPTIGIPQNGELLSELVPVVSFLAVWRIPLLFMISGMGVRFALERRDWKGLLVDRTLRLVVPFVFCFFVLGGVVTAILPLTGWDADYVPGFGHLWFLANIYAYVLWLIYWLVALKNHPDNPFTSLVSRIVRMPLGLFMFAIPMILESWLVSPENYSIYVDTLHGWLIGLICFFWGFLFICVQDDFWPAVRKTRWIALLVASSLYAVRLLVFELQGEPAALTALESMSWMLAVIGFGSVYLNRQSRLLSYLSSAVYPVYIVHFPLQFILAFFLLPLQLNAYLKLLLLLAGTFGSCLLLYELVLRRLKWIRPLFGMKLKGA